MFEKESGWKDERMQRGDGAIMLAVARHGAMRGVLQVPVLCAPDHCATLLMLVYSAQKANASLATNSLLPLQAMYAGNWCVAG